ncbi:flagellar hook-length control protein FliK [Methyloterricola oryzae]|uniref:flagellar hook-length control protein FliK n=1 Tax=Methyloterricola oryzae TaxID=1495050 RepID=UPI00069B6D2E|nr:flagellar hook-length control protein FliK [Methyloterricola oryzae]
MSTESLLSMQPASAGFSLGVAGVAATPATAGEGSDAFLNALVNKIKGLSPDVVTAEASAPVAAEGAAVPLPMEDFTAFIEQIKVLAGQAAVSKTAEGGGDSEADGNLLPVPLAGEGDALPLTTAQLEQLVNQLLGRTASPAPATPEATASATEGTSIAQSTPQTLLTATGSAQTSASAVSRQNLPIPSEDSDTRIESGVPELALPQAAVAATQLPAPAMDQPAPAPAPVAAAPFPASTQGTAASSPPVQAALNAGSVESGATRSVPAVGAVPSPPAQASNESMQVEPTSEAWAEPGPAAPVATSTPVNPAVTAAVIPVPAAPFATAVASAIKGEAPPSAAPNAAASVPFKDALGSSLDDMALTPELLQLVAAKVGKAETGEAAPLAQPLTSTSQGTRMADVLPEGFDLGRVAQALPQDMRSGVQPPQTGVPAMSTPFGRPDWSDDFGERVVWMTGKGIQSAELQLNPQHLGPVEVRINLSQDQASVQFVAHHAAVRDAIEAAIPKLREMLGAQQLNLADVSVAQQSFQDPRDFRGAQQAYDQQSQSSGHGSGQPLGGGVDEPGQIEGETAAVHQSGRGLLNLYA